MQTHRAYVRPYLLLHKQERACVRRDKKELVVEFGEVNTVKYVDWDDIKGVKFNKLKITKEVDEDITYISWFVYDETEDEKWVDVFENYWDNIYCSIDIILTRELKNLLNK